MKFFNAAAYAVLGLAMTGTTMAWECGRAGGPGLEGVQRAHLAFNNLYGSGALTGGDNHCFYSACEGLVFGWCTNQLGSTTEGAGDRDRAANEDPGTGSFCSWWPEEIRRPYYVFSNEADITIDDSLPRIDLRRC